MKNEKLKEMLSKANKSQMEKSNNTSAFEVLNKSDEDLIKGGFGQSDTKGCTCKKGEFSCTTFG